LLVFICNLPKWSGHLYNWYNIETLEPLKPRYVSSVDSGNFIGYLYVLKQFLIQNGHEDGRIDKLIEETDFTKLYNEKMQLFSILYQLYKCPLHLGKLHIVSSILFISSNVSFRVSYPKS